MSSSSERPNIDGTMPQSFSSLSVAPLKSATAPSSALAGPTISPLVVDERRRDGTDGPMVKGERAGPGSASVIVVEKLNRRPGRKPSKPAGISKLSIAAVAVPTFVTDAGTSAGTDKAVPTATVFRHPPCPLPLAPLPPCRRCARRRTSLRRHWQTGSPTSCPAR